MRLSLATLTVLSWAGDTSAEQAKRQWLNLARFNTSPDDKRGFPVRVACWTEPGTTVFAVALISEGESN